MMAAEDDLGATARLARFATETTSEDISGKVFDNARLIVLDTIGVSLAALDLPIGRIVTDYVRALGGDSPSGVSGVFGTDVRSAPPLAALANGTLAHGLDFDDHMHLSTHTLPATVAVGEMLGAPGARVLEAYVIGREVGTRLSLVIEAKRKLQQGPTFRGWYRVGVIGPIAAAVSAGKVLDLDEEQMTIAIAIAASSSAGLRRNMGTMTKALHAGNAASNGIHAAMLASRGFTADREALEAPLGLVSAICLPGEAEWEPLDLLGNPFDLGEHIGAKPIPACSPSHMPVAAILKLRERHGVDPAEVVSIEADLHTFSLLRLDPQEAIATGYSLPYLLSVALIDGQVAVDQVSEARLWDPAVRDLMTKVVHDPQAARSRESERVTVRLKDGTVLSDQVTEKQDLREAEPIKAKFVANASRRLPANRVDTLQKAIESVESLTDIRELTEHMKP